MASNEQAFSASDDVSKLTPEQRLKSLLFQYAKLYERWAEDRQEFNKGMAQQEEMLKYFTQKINQFGELEPNVRQQLIGSIKKAIDNLADDIGTKMGNSAVAVVSQTAKELKSAVNDAANLLMEYQVDVRITNTRFFMIQAIATGTAIIVSFLMTSHLISKMPTPLVPLTGDMLQTYIYGEELQDAWSGLPNRTKKEIIEVTHKKTGLHYPFKGLSSGGDEGQQSGDNSG